jgi:hypothetical protein
MKSLANLKKNIRSDVCPFTQLGDGGCADASSILQFHLGHVFVY